jgi:hypothetical protein
VNVAFALADVFVAHFDALKRCRRVFVVPIESSTFDSRAEEVTRLVHRGIVDAGHGLVGFLVSFRSSPLRVVLAC